MSTPDNSKSCNCMGDCWHTEAVCVEEAREEGLVYLPALMRAKKVSVLKYSKAETCPKLAVNTARKFLGLEPLPTN